MQKTQFLCLVVDNYRMQISFQISSVGPGWSNLIFLLFNSLFCFLQPLTHLWWEYFLTNHFLMILISESAPAELKTPSKMVKVVNALWSYIFIDNSVYSKEIWFLQVEGPAPFKWQMLIQISKIFNFSPTKLCYDYL